MSKRTPETKDEDALSEAELAELEHAPALSSLLKRSLAADDAAPDKDAALLASVQKKLRTRSKGKFYGDGWSTSYRSIHYGLIAAIMLLTVLAVYFALGPTGFSLR